MTVTAIVVMNHENKLTTTKNPLLRVQEVEELMRKYAEESVAFIDAKQYGLRVDICKGSKEIFVVVDEHETPIVGPENLHPKSAEMLIKHYHKAKTHNVVLFVCPKQIDRVKAYIDQVLLVTINNPSKETEIISSGFIDNLNFKVARKQLTISTWSIREASEEHKRRYSVKIYS